ncbi:MAG: hypothetical protein UHH87_01940, partial [Akkermansia sp.]|nr:hypothetical protein [Akkermansia sp.]
SQTDWRDFSLTRERFKPRGLWADKIETRNASRKVYWQAEESLPSCPFYSRKRGGAGCVLCNHNKEEIWKIKQRKTPQVVKLAGFRTDREGFEPSVRF